MKKKKSTRWLHAAHGNKKVEIYMGPTNKGGKSACQHVGGGSPHP
jgi:hypothetical protein